MPLACAPLLGTTMAVPPVLELPPDQRMLVREILEPPIVGKKQPAPRADGD